MQTDVRISWAVGGRHHLSRRLRAAAEGSARVRAGGAGGDGRQAAHRRAAPRRPQRTSWSPSHWRDLTNAASTAMAGTPSRRNSARKRQSCARPTDAAFSRVPFARRSASGLTNGPGARTPCRAEPSRTRPTLRGRKTTTPARPLRRPPHQQPRRPAMQRSGARARTAAPHRRGDLPQQLHDALEPLLVAAHLRYAGGHGLRRCTRASVGLGRAGLPDLNTRRHGHDDAVTFLCHGNAWYVLAACSSAAQRRLTDRCAVRQRERASEQTGGEHYAAQVLNLLRERTPQAQRGSQAARKFCAAVRAWLSRAARMRPWTAPACTRSWP